MSDAPPVATTVGRLVQDGTTRLTASGSESPRLDAELLLGHVLGISRTTVLAHPEARPGAEQIAAFDAAIERRTAGEPVAYIRGLKEFYGLAFTVDARALIPRPETERLVDLAEQHIRATLAGAPRPADAPPLLTWDVGTGSGAIPVALAVTLRRHGFGEAVRFLATDRSAEAVSLAVENAVAHGVADVIAFATADLFDTALDARPKRPVDLVVANLPYIPTGDIETLPVAASFEPHDALDGGADGLDQIGRLIRGLPVVLSTEGVGLVEIGGDQEALARALAIEALPDWTVSIHQDLGGQPRVLEVRAPAGGQR